MTKSRDDNRTPTRYRFDAFVLDTETRLLSRDDEEVPVQPKTFDTLAYLLANAHRVVAKQELLDAVWGKVVVTENVLARVVSALRKILGDTPQESRFIKAVPRVGYRFVAEMHVDVGQSDDDVSRSALAILPFQPVSSKHADESLELGMAETLFSILSAVPGLLVRPFRSVAATAIDQADMNRLFDDFAVDYCVDGSIQQQAGRIRVYVRLVSRHGTKTIWSGKFDANSADIFEAQDAICGRIAKELLPRLDTTLHPVRRTSSVAHRQYLEGRLFLSRFTVPDVERALSCFESALDEDPTYAPAWAGIAECHDFRGTVGEDPRRCFEAAASASKRAIAIDPGTPEAVIMLAKVAWQYEWNWRSAEVLFDSATRRFPNRADVYIGYSDYSCYRKQTDRAIEYAKEALTIDPVSPWVNTLYAQALYMDGDFESAIEQAEKTLDLAPGFPFAHFFMALAQALLGDYESSLVNVERAVASGRSDFMGVLGALYALVDRRIEAEKILEDLVAAQDAVPPIAPAIVRMALGEFDAAAQDLRRCIAVRDWHILLLHADPLIAKLGAHNEAVASVLEDIEGL